MSTCGTLAANLTADCANPLTPGTEDNLYLINKEDITGATFDVANPLVMTGFTLAATKKVYKVEGKKNSNVPSSTLAKKKYDNFHKHQVEFVGFNIDPAVKKEIDKIPHGEYVAIVENKHKGTAGNTAFEVYGWKNGMICDKLDRNPTDADSGGAYMITLASDDATPEPHIPYTLFTTDYATTLAIITALLAP